MQPPFFSALHALAIDDGGGRAGFSFALLPTRHIKHVMDAIQRAVVAPQVEIVEKCAARRQIFRDRTPLASRAQNMIPFITSRTSTWRLLPPRLAGGINGSTCAHSSSVRSLGYRSALRSYRLRFFAVHIGDPPRIRPPHLNHK